MKLAFLVVVVALLAGLALVAKTLSKGGRKTIPTRARPVMTKNEQPMYWRLRETFPDAVVLAQVAFSALITSAREHRNRYDRKVADFVLLDKGMNVLAVIELDDSTHKGKEDSDAARAALLETAGLRVVRFPRVPDAEALKAAVQPLAAPAKQQKAASRMPT